METELYRMNPEIDSSSGRSPVDQCARSTDVQSQGKPPASPDLDGRPCSSFSTTSSSDHQTSLPCSTGSDQSRANGEFATADLEFGGGYSNTPATLPTQATDETTSLSQNNLLDKVDNNSTHSAARSCSPSAASESPLVSGSLIESLNRQLTTPPSAASPKLQDSNLSAEKLSRVDARDDEGLTEKLTEQLKEQLAEHLNQQLINQQIELGQQLNDQQLNDQKVNETMNETVSSPEASGEDEEGSEEECSSEEEAKTTPGTASAPANSKKRSRSDQAPHLCSKKRRKQSNPVRCDFEPADNATVNDANKLSQWNQISQQINQQLKQLLTEQLKSQLAEQTSADHAKGQVAQENLEKRKPTRAARSQPEAEDDQEEGLVCKFPNALSGAANATVRFFLANHQASGNSKNGDAGESPINYTYYLAAAAAVATRASLKGTKHCLNYCKECCCPFLSTEHERQYRQLERQAGREIGSEPAATQQPPNNAERSVFAQQLANLAQQSKLMQEMESVFGSSYEAGQLPQRNAIDAMQLIKQLESGQLDNEEAKVHQQQLANLLLNTNMLSVSSGQTANQLSALLAGRIFNPDAYCSICKKEFCNKYFLKTHMANKHGIQDQQSAADKCISPTNNLDKFLKGQQKQKAQPELVECSNPKSSASAKQSETTAQQLQHELMNAISASEPPTNEDLIGRPNEQQKEIIRNQLHQLQLLSSATQMQQMAVEQAEQFANILRNSIVQPPNTNNSSDLSNTDLAKLLNSNNANFFFTPERLREMGVNNPEAFCEICLKEFCNKYFLKTHKANKHGIQMDEEELGANSSNSCDSKSNHHNDQNTDKSNREMCNVNDDESMEPGQCHSSINPMDLTTLLMINNLKGHPANQLLGQQANSQQQLTNPQLNQQLSINQAQRNSKDSPLSLNTSINKVEQESMDFRVAAAKNKLLASDLAAKAFPRNELEMYRWHANKIFANDHADASDKLVEQPPNTIDRNNNSNNEENVPKELASAGLDLSQPQSILGQEKDLLRFQQLIKELQSNTETDLEQEIFKKLSLIHQQQRLAPKLNEEINVPSATYCDFCEKEFKSRTALRNHNCPGNENNRLSESPSNSVFSNISAQMANTLLNNSNNSTLNYAMNGDAESLVNSQKGKSNKQVNITANGRDALINNLNMGIAGQQTANRLSPSQNNALFNLQTSLPPNTPFDVAQSIFGSDKSGITLDPNNKQPKFVAGRNYCNLCKKELCNKYFMKTHMMKMHNINIDEHPAEAAASSIVGGVMCDLCKKELCSKYFLKVHKQNTHGITEDGTEVPITNQQQVSAAAGLMTTSSTVQSSLPTSLVSTQSTLSPNTCISSANGLINQANSLNPLLSNAYEAGLSKEHIQQLQLELSKHPNFLGLKNGNSMQQAAFLEQHSNTPISFGASTGSTNSQATPPLNGQPIGASEKELFYLQGIDPADITNRYFNQCTEICPFCKRRFKSIKWMKTHIANEHPNMLNNSPSGKGAVNLSAKQPVNDQPEKMRCLFCTKLFSDSGLLHYHLVNDHRTSLEEMIMATGMDLTNNFGAAEDTFGRSKAGEQADAEKGFARKPNKLEDQLSILQGASGELLKNEALLNELLSKNRKQPAKKVGEQKNKSDELADGREKSKNSELDGDQRPSSEQSDVDEPANAGGDEAEEKATTNSHQLTNILQLMRKHQNGGTAGELSAEEEDEEDEESLSEEERFAAMLNNNAQLQQLLHLSGAQQPSTSGSAANNSKALSIYEELMGQQPAANPAELSSSNDDNQPESELSEYERYNRAMQHQLMQQLKQDQLSTRLAQQQQQQQQAQQQQQNARGKAQPASRGGNSVYTKLYQCNACEYNTRWLSNLYAHEKRRHNTCSSSSGNLKVITIRRDTQSPNSALAANRTNAQLNLNSLLNGLDGGKLGAIPGQSTGRLDSAELMSQLNDFNNNQSLSNSFANLLQPNDKPSRPIKERTASGDGQFVCHICNRSYRHKHSLHRHLVCHRNSAEAANSGSSAIKGDLNFKQSDQSRSPSNELLNAGLPFAQPPSNGTSTPSLFANSSTGRSSVDSVNSGEHSLKQAGSQASNQLANQMFGALNQEMLESFLISSGSNSSLLGNLIAGSSSNVHSPNNAATTGAYSSSTNDNAAVTTGAANASNSAAMFSV